MTNRTKILNHQQMQLGKKADFKQKQKNGAQKGLN
jgi:hypothetical protein